MDKPITTPEAQALCIGTGRAAFDLVTLVDHIAVVFAGEVSRPELFFALTSSAKTFAQSIDRNLETLATFLTAVEDIYVA